MFGYQHGIRIYIAAKHTINVVVVVLVFHPEFRRAMLREVTSSNTKVVSFCKSNS